MIRLKWRPEILHEIEYLVFHNYFGLKKKEKNSSEIHVFQSDQFSLLMYRCLLRRLLLSKWITNKTWKMLVMQRIMTLLYELRIKSYCVDV